MYIHLEKISKINKDAQMRNIPYKQPQDNVWKQLREDLALKHDADFLSGNRQAFKLFCSMLNIKLFTEGVLAISEEEIDIIKDAFDGSTHNMFSWDHLRLLTDSQYNNLIDSMEHMLLTVKESLTLSKYQFTQKFVEEKDAEEFWQGGVQRTLADFTI